MSAQNPFPAPELPPLPPSERGRKVALLVGSAIAVLALAVAGVVVSTQDNEQEGPAGSSQDLSAPCRAPESRLTDGIQTHVTDPDVKYADSPPSFGQHFGQWQPFGRSFYAEDRPPVSVLVHNLEHGYAIAWYDEVAAADPAAMKELRTLAEGYAQRRERFLAVPWTAADGAPFPDGMHVAVTRWSADPAFPADVLRQRGNWLYCGGVDSDAISDFYDTFPNAQSPEPGIPLEGAVL